MEQGEEEVGGFLTPAPLPHGRQAPTIPPPLFLEYYPTPHFPNSSFSSYNESPRTHIKEEESFQSKLEGKKSMEGIEPTRIKKGKVHQLHFNIIIRITECLNKAWTIFVGKGRL